MSGDPARDTGEAGDVTAGKRARSVITRQPLTPDDAHAAPSPSLRKRTDG